MNRFKWAVAVVAACMLAAVVYVGGRASAQAPAAAVVRAQRFELVDAQGHVTAALGTVEGSESDFGLLLYDKGGTPRGALMVHRNGAVGLGLYGKDGKGRLAVAVNPPDWNPGVTLFDNNEARRAVLSLRSDGSPSLDLWDKEGLGRIVMAMEPPDWPVRAPDAIARLPVARPQGGPMLELADTEGKLRAALTLLPEGSPSLVMWDQEEKQLWKAP